MIRSNFNVNTQCFQSKSLPLIQKALRKSSSRVTCKHCTVGLWQVRYLRMILWWWYQFPHVVYALAPCQQLLRFPGGVRLYGQRLEETRGWSGMEVHAEQTILLLLWYVHINSILYRIKLTVELSSDGSKAH